MALHKELLNDGTQHLEHYFLCNYVPLTTAKDELSRSLIRFKKRLEVDLTAWVECSESVLESIVFSPVIIVRALGHEEQAATYSALDHLGVKLAESIGCKYQPHLLKKRNLSSPLKRLNRADRIKALKDVYYFNGEIENSTADFLIIDDILTTGTTATAIAKAIKEKRPSANILVFTLAKVDYTLQMNEQSSFEGEHFRWQDNSWEVREDEVAYNKISSLKNKILTDSF